MTPQLRFPEFTDEWQVKKLGEFSSITTGKLDANAMVENGRYRFYTCAREFYKIDQYAFDTEALLVSGNGANVGYIHYYKGKFNAYQRTYVLDNFRENIGYIKLYLDRYLKKRILQEKFEGNMPYIVLSTLKDMPISTPPTKEQEKIADFLTAVDERIAVGEKKLELLEAYKRGVMQKIFSQKIRFRDENGNGYPEWEENKLGELGKFTSGVGFTNSEQGGKHGTPFYKVSDMNLSGNTNEMTQANNYVSDTQVIDMKYKPIIDKSIIFAKVGAAIFLERKRVASNFLIDNNMMAFTPNGNLDFQYIKIVFDRLHLSKMAQVGALPSYNGSDLAIIKIQLPSHKEQQKIATFLTALDDKIIAEKSKLTAAKQFKKALLQRMFV